MRSTGVLLFIALAACSSDDKDAGADASVDASVAPDTGMPDSGRFGVACGATNCAETEYCLVTPNGSCAANDGGACTAPEEACQKEGISGCTPPRTRACTALPNNCSACPCLVIANPCGTQQADCRKPQGMGVTVECPYP